MPAKIRVLPASAPTDGGGSFAWSNPGNAQTQNGSGATNNTAAGTPTNQLIMTPDWAANASSIGEIYGISPIARIRRSAGTADNCTGRFRFRTVSTELWNEESVFGTATGSFADFGTASPFAIASLTEGEANYTVINNLRLELVRAGAAIQNPTIEVDLVAIDVFAWSPRVDANFSKTVRPSSSSQASGSHNWANLSNLGDVSATTYASCTTGSAGGTPFTTNLVTSTVSVSDTNLAGTVDLKELRVIFDNIKIETSGTPTNGADGYLQLVSCTIENATGTKQVTTAHDAFNTANERLEVINGESAEATGRLIVSFRDSSELSALTIAELADLRVKFSFKHDGQTPGTDPMVIGVGSVSLEARWNQLAAVPDPTITSADGKQLPGAPEGSTLAFKVSLGTTDEVLDPSGVTLEVDVGPMIGGAETFVELTNNDDGTFTLPASPARVLASATKNAQFDVPIRMSSDQFATSPSTKNVKFVMYGREKGVIPVSAFKSYILDMVLGDLFDEQDKPAKATRPLI